MRDAAFACIRRIGVETGGSNVQFGLDPTNGHMVVIEMNPRVSRSSALASKATGFPIAKIAAKLAVGYRLDEVRNDITEVTPASFEPTIDYVVTKVPRWAFEKLPGAEPVLGTMMQSVGEVMAIGRTFPESLQKAMRSLETGRDGLDAARPGVRGDGRRGARAGLPHARRPTACSRSPTRSRAASPSSASTRSPRSTRGSSTRWPRSWRPTPSSRAMAGPDALDRRTWRWAKRLGFGDGQLAAHWDVDRRRRARRAAGRRASTSRTRRSTPARRSSRRPRRTTTAPTRTRARSRRSRSRRW